MQQVNFAVSKYLTDKKCKLIFVPLRGQPKGHLEKEQLLYISLPYATYHLDEFAVVFIENTCMRFPFLV